MRLYTAQLAKWRIAQKQQLTLVDTTAKSGLAMFAPDWGNVAAYKKGVMGEAEYTDLYLEKMRQSYREKKSVWLQFIKQDTVVIACYCPSGKFCHRHLLKEILERLCVQQGVDFEYVGELE